LESDAEEAPIKLADFGLAGVLPTGGRLFDPCGSPGYVAPELLDSIFETDEGYGKEVDLWALGVICYLL
jgi:serine/threonine protein kinase